MTTTPTTTPTGIPDTLQLGGLSLQSPFLLAPLEGVSDAGFRRLCFEQGAGLTWTEMIRARGLAKRNKSTLDLVDTFDADVPTGIQLLTTAPNELLDALSVIEDLAATTHPHFSGCGRLRRRAAQRRCGAETRCRGSSECRRPWRL